MLSALNEWSTRCASTLADLERQIARIKSDALARHKEEIEWAAHVERLVDGKKSQEEKAKETIGSGFMGNVGKKLGLGSGAAMKRGSASQIDGDEDVDMDIDGEDDDDGDRKGSTRSAKAAKRNMFGMGGK